MIKLYFLVTKPIIILGNLVSMVAGFLFASKKLVDVSLLSMTIAGVTLVIASSCVFNNYIDRDIDPMMERTKGRMIANLSIPLRTIILYAYLLGISGFTLLFFYTNLLATAFALLGFIVYIGFYSFWLKRKSAYAALVGSFSGAAPPVIGYCAVSGQFDMAALLLLLIFTLWQIPHFYAIAIFRFDDYRAASIPVFPLVKGITVTKNHIVLYLTGFIIAAMMLPAGGYVGHYYLLIVGAISTAWLLMALSGYKTRDNHHWARKMFIFSIVVITLLNVMISVDYSISRL